MKYFFLAESWTTGRVWEFGGLWDEIAWKREPLVSKQPLYIKEDNENLWLYKAEDAILMIEVMPEHPSPSTIGQVVLKRLLSAEQVVERLCQENVFHPAHTTQKLATNPSNQIEPNQIEPKTQAQKSQDTNIPPASSLDRKPKAQATLANPMSIGSVSVS